MSQSPEYRAHQEWLGYVQPVGLVVSIPALLSAQAYVNRNIAAEHQGFLSLLARDPDDEIIPEIPDFRAFAQTVLGWEAADLVAAPEDLSVALPAYGEVLSPTFAVPDAKAKDASKPWLMLVQCLAAGTELDSNTKSDTHQWEASPQSKLEHLLLRTGVPIGILFNHTHLRLVYKPQGENSGHITFSVANMAEVSGRPIFAALHMLLSAERLFVMPEKERLPTLLAESRKYQNVVSTKLAEQVLAALYELVHGFQAADAQRRGELLREVLQDDPNQVYAGLLTVLLRLVFVLYAEDRDLLSRDDVYTRFYSITGLYARLREDAGRYHDTMEQRYGAWAQLLVLFRLVYDGARHGKMNLPAREGYLFDPDRYPFLEGRPQKSKRANVEKLAVPPVSDGVVYRVLQNLLILDGERLSYRSLDVEHIGGVYETMMGFNLEVAQGRSIAIKPTKSHGAPATINLDALLAQKPVDRVKWLKEQSDQSLTGQAAEALKSAKTIDELVAALDKKIARHATPNLVPPGAMVLQPSDERRRSGSHYTPRSLTEPIVRTTLRPILERLSEKGAPTPDELLDFKICDPAMGSGAFLVEACRQLAATLVESWHAHRCVPQVPPDEDEEKHAMRIVAQRCLYGVDKNPMAVDLAKLSLWLATLAKDHPFTFLDHNLKHGDSLVGLTQKQIEQFTWEGVEADLNGGRQSPESAPRRKKSAKSKDSRHFFGDPIKDKLQHALSLRHKLLSAPENEAYTLMRKRLQYIDENLDLARLVGDLVIAAFFCSEKDKQRQEALADHGRKLTLFFGDKQTKTDLMMRLELQRIAEALRAGDRPLSPFHWEIEFPEVFLRENGGFDAIVGNPPFAGKNSLSLGQRESFTDWLKLIHPHSHGNADLVAHFLCRAYLLIRSDGTFGLIATNTVGQGDTRATSLTWIRQSHGQIYSATRRMKWPGSAAVVVSVVHVAKNHPSKMACILDGRNVTQITAFLFDAGPDESPACLLANEGKSFQGPIALGMGFTFDDSDKKGIASSLTDMVQLQKDPKNRALIFPYLGGEEINDSPTHRPRRYIINFGERSETEARKWPELFQIIEQRVKPERMLQNDKGAREKWWQFIRPRPEMMSAIADLERFIAIPFVGKWLAPVFVERRVVIAGPANVIAAQSFAAFTSLQSRAHDIWTRLLASSLKDDTRYTPSDCFETFPFPRDFESNPELENIGRKYYEFRAALMVKNDEGLTKTYNRFHDPDETAPDILRLRELHAAMDRVVLEAYGWHDLAERATCEFLLDYEEDDDEEAATTRRKKKKPWRYRWPDDFRDEVLARLLELNKQRAEEERLSGLTATSADEKKAKRGSTRKRVASPKLPGMDS